jgi:hypothetical protein
MLFGENQLTFWCSACCILYAGFFLDLIIDREDGGNTFLWSFSSLSPDYTVLWAIREDRIVRGSLYFNVHIFRQWRSRKYSDLNGSKQSQDLIGSLSFFMNVSHICWCHSQIFVLCHTFKWSIIRAYVMVLPCILVTRCNIYICQ